MSSETIYRQLWALDRKPGNGGARVVSVPIGGSPGALGTGALKADIVLDEQAEASGKRGIDLATRPLFRHVSAVLLERPTHAAFRRLLDNYVVNYRAAEVSSPEEEEEARAFIDLIDRTEVMDAAFAHVSSRLQPGLTRERFRDELRRMWFTRYTNHYKGRSTRFCSGFEHVFVGEGKYRPRPGAAEIKGEVSGYHSWVKFYLDEASGRVDFLGYNYDLQGGQGPDDPRVVTLQMRWDHRDAASEQQVELFKRVGGFFVGSSPEAEIALGTVAFYQSAAGLVTGDEIPTTLGDDGRRFRLVIYRNTERDGSRGAFIRSFFPKYLGGGDQRPDGTP